MFSQKKKSYTWIYVSIVLAILIAAAVILIGALTSKVSDEEALQANLEMQAREEIKQETQENTDSQHSYEDSGEPAPEGISSGPEHSGEKNHDQTQFYSSYYLVKTDKNSIKIYFSDETGRLTELEETAIVYETLGAEDQKRFREGIKVESRDDLNRLMMDYES